MATNLAFDDIARNLLVFLKGQVPSLSAKTDKDEIFRQIQSITFTLRSTIIQLEGAAYGDNDAFHGRSDLLSRIDELTESNTKLERAIKSEREINNQLSGQLNRIRTSMDSFDEERNNLEDVLSRQKEENHKLYSELDKLRAETEKYKSECENIKISSSNNTESEAVIISLKTKLAELESALSDSKTDVAALRQALQKKEVEVRKGKEALLDAINVDKTELEDLKTKLESFESIKSENESLKKQKAELESCLNGFPSKEEYTNNISSLNTKIKFLEESLFKSQTDLKEAERQLDAENPHGIVKEKAALEQKVATLEDNLRNVVAAREAETLRSKNSFSFNSDECIFVFESLSNVVRRLENSPENRDVYLRAKESISILEKNKAISKIPTLGHQLDSRVHKVTKSFIADFLPDEMVIFEETTGFVSGSKLIQKAIVWIAKSKFTCSECGKASKPNELFCTQCGYELIAADGTSKREMPPFPTKLEVNLPLLDEMMKQGNIKASTKLMEIISKVSPNNPEVVKKQAILSRVDPGFSMYPTY